MRETVQQGSENAAGPRVGEEREGAGSSHRLSGNWRRKRRHCFRLAAGISEDTAAVAREPGQRSRSQENEGNQPDRLQPLVRDLMKTLLEDHTSLLTETDLANLMDRDHTQNILGLQLGGFPLLRGSV